jgi:hypothetical protein
MDLLRLRFGERNEREARGALLERSFGWRPPLRATAAALLTDDFLQVGVGIQLHFGIAVVGVSVGRPPVVVVGRPLAGFFAATAAAVVSVSASN